MAELETTSRLDLLAEILGLTPRRVQQLAEEGIIPKPDKPGFYDIPTCVKNFYYNELVDPEDDELDGRHERARKAKAEADRIEFDLKIKQGQYVQAEVVEYVLTGIISNCRAKLLALPRKLAPTASTAQTPNEVEDILTKGINEALDELVKPVFNDSTNRGNTENTGDSQESV